MSDVPERVVEDSPPTGDDVDIGVLMAQGHSILLDGPGGTGKSYKIRAAATYLTEAGFKVVCTSTTAVAALNISVPEKEITSTTIHRWSGVDLGKGTKEELLIKVSGKKAAVKRWREVDCLFIDEISMCGEKLFTALEYIARNIREIDAPFGGIVLCVSGDFLQLPPVKDEWVFTSERWHSLNFTSIRLTQPKRYEDIAFFEMLLRIREGEHTAADIKVLNSRRKAYALLKADLAEAKVCGTIDVIHPTMLYARKMDVETFNVNALEQLAGERKVFWCEDEYLGFTSEKKRESARFSLNVAAPETVVLKVGAQVMLTFNMSVEEGLVNGSRGVVLRMSDEHITVRFVCGKRLRVKRHTYTVAIGGGIATRKQFPFALAWAMTIHKSQGATLDYAVCDLGESVFACAQAYVALSRMKSIHGLFLSSFVKESIRVDKQARDYVRSLGR